MATVVGWLGKLKRILSKTRSSVISRVEVEYDAGLGNQLYIRGEGAWLSWEKGVPMNNTHGSCWTWDTKATFNRCCFKVLINDVQYEVGDNRTLAYGGTVRYKPKF